MSSPPASPERVIDVASDSPALLRVPRDDGDETSENDDDVDDARGLGLSELELAEHEYRRGRHAIPMQSPGDEGDLEIDMEPHSVGRNDRRRARLPALRRRHFFESDEVLGSRRRMMQRITFRRRKKGENDAFWTGIFISNVLSLAVMAMLMFYLLQTDFFESHQSDLFGTTVDNRFTVVSPENSDAKIYMKSGYSTSRYSEAMIAFGNGELKIGRRALGPTDLQAFYGFSLASNGSATFTNKLNAPFVKTDYLHAARAVVFDDGTVMTTAANLSGGINEVGDLNLISKTGSITISAGGKPVVKVDPDATVNLLNSNEEDPEAAGITMDAAKGDFSIATAFKIHHDRNSTAVSSSNPIQLNTSRLLVGDPHAAKATISCPPPTNIDPSTKLTKLKPTSLVVMGQSSANQTRGGSVIVGGGDGWSQGGDVLLVGGESAENGDGDVSRGSVLINAKLDRTTASTTVIGTHSKSHKVSLHGAVSVNNASDSGHATSLYIGGGNFVASSKNITLSNAATNGSTVKIKSNSIALETSAGSSLVLGARSTILKGTEQFSVSLLRKTNTSTESAGLMVDASGTLELNASSGIRIQASGDNSSVDFVGAVRFGVDPTGRNDSDSSPDMVIEDGDITIDADTLTVGGEGSTDAISLFSPLVRIGNASVKSSLHLAGSSTEIKTTFVQVGSERSEVQVNGNNIVIHANTSSANNSSSMVSIRGPVVSLTGGNLVVGDKQTKSIAIGDESTGHVSIASSVLDVGLSATTLTIGNKAASVKIGDDKSTIELQGKVTLNGQPLETRRQLESLPASLIGIASAHGVTLQISNAGSEVNVPVSLLSPSARGFADAVGGNIQLGSLTDVTHLRLSVALQSVRMRVDGGTHFISSSRRSPKLRCRVYRGSDQLISLLEVVAPLELCEDEIDCKEGIFYGASASKLVSVLPGDSLSLRCVASPMNEEFSGTREVMIDEVQLDISAF